MAKSTTLEFADGGGSAPVPEVKIVPLARRAAKPSLNWAMATALLSCGNRLVMPEFEIRSTVPSDRRNVPVRPSDSIETMLERDATAVEKVPLVAQVFTVPLARK